MKTLVCSIAVSCFFLVVCFGCDVREKSILTTQTEYVYLKNASLATDPDTGTLGINYVVQPDTYAAHTGSIPAGSVEPIPGVITQVHAGVPWFDLSAIPSGTTIVSVKLVLNVNAAPVTAITVQIHDLPGNPLIIDTGNPTECQAVYDDACTGEIYAAFDVDSSQSIVEIMLSSQAVLDIQSALDGGIGFGVGLRASEANETNIVDVSFINNTYLEIGYQE